MKCNCLPVLSFWSLSLDFKFQFHFMLKICISHLTSCLKLPPAYVAFLRYPSKAPNGTMPSLGHNIIISQSTAKNFFSTQPFCLILLLIHLQFYILPRALSLLFLFLSSSVAFLKWFMFLLKKFSDEPFDCLYQIFFIEKVLIIFLLWLWLSVICGANTNHFLRLFMSASKVLSSGK